MRHHLSLNRLFEIQERPCTDPGFGSYWTCNLNAPSGEKRPRKRGRHAQKDDAEDDRPAPKKKSTPRHAAKNTKMSEAPSTSILPDAGDDRSLRTCQVSSTRSSGDDEDAEMRSIGDSEEGVDEGQKVPAANNPFSLSLVTAFTTPVDRIASLENEMATLRRQCSDTTTLSLQLSDSLRETQAEISRAKGAVLETERMFEEESARRSEATRIAEEREISRRILEEELRSLRASMHDSM